MSFQVGGSGTVYTAYPNFNDNVWRHFTFVINPNEVIIYANGKYYNSITITGFYPNIDNGGYIGKSTANDPLFTDSIDDIRLYDKIVSAEEAQQIYTNTYP